MAHEGSVVHIGGACFVRHGDVLHPITKAQFDRTVQGKHVELVTWDPKGLDG